MSALQTDDDLHPHAELIERLGGPTEVAEQLTKLTRQLYTPERVGMWKQPYRGISWPARHHVVTLLRAKKIKVPKGFI